AWSRVSPLALRSRRSEATRGGGRRPRQNDARAGPLCAPLSRITAIGARPAPLATAKIVSSVIAPPASPVLSLSAGYGGSRGQLHRSQIGHHGQVAGGHRAD